MLNSYTYSLPEKLENAVQLKLDEWKTEGKIAKVWAKDASVWTNTDEAKWLGWLTIAEEEAADTAKYHELQKDIEQAGFTDVLLMGMGGSSLCPEVLAITFGKQNFHILDSTVPSQVKAVEDKLDLAKTLLIVASKSGSTLEPNCFKQYFFDRVSQITDGPGKQFIAITDPGSKMEQIAKHICAAHDATCDFRFERYYPPTINTEAEADFARRVMGEIVGPDNVLRQEAAMTSEDFAFMLQAKPGAYAFIGNGDGAHRDVHHGEGPCTLHNASYDFNDDLIPLGATCWVQLAEQFLKPGGAAA
jgi:hypothetical protein